MICALLPVVIVNFNAGGRLTDCVRSVLASDCPVVVHVSDNGSTDDSLSLLRREFGHDPRLTIRENRANLGFARGNNVVLPELPASEYILFLNPDCVVQPDTLSAMMRTIASHPAAGLACCLIRNPDGSEQRGCRRRLPTPWQALIQVLQLQRFTRWQSFNLHDTPLPDLPVVVEAVSGAFMLVRRTAMARVGLLDEGYFLHCEDIDWCARFGLAGHPVLFVPQVSIVHHQGSCSHRRPLRVEWHKHRGMLRYYRKFHARRYPAPLMLAVYAMVGVRFGMLAVWLTARRLKYGSRAADQ